MLLAPELLIRLDDVTLSGFIDDLLLVQSPLLVVYQPPLALDLHSERMDLILPVCVLDLDDLLDSALLVLPVLDFLLFLVDDISELL